MSGSGSGYRREAPVVTYKTRASRDHADPDPQQGSATEGLSIEDGDEPRPSIIINRPVLPETKLEERLERSKSVKKRKMAQKKTRFFEKIRNPRQLRLMIKKGVFAFFPFINVMRTYKFKEYFANDLLSGLSVGMFIIPQAIAYSVLANVKPQHGFYSALFGMLIYFFLGSSNHLNMSSQGVISLLVGQVVEVNAKCSNVQNVTTFQFYEYAQSNSSEDIISTIVPLVHSTCIDGDLAIKVAVSLTLLCGIFQIIFGLFHLGFLSIFLSDSLVSAFTCGAALHIVGSQLPKILGVTGNKKTSELGLLFINLINVVDVINTVNGGTLLVFGLCFLALMIGRAVNPKIVKYTKVPIPFDILVLIAALLASKYGNLSQTFKVRTVGEIYKGFESPTLPDATLMGQVVIDALVLAIVSYAICISVAKAYAVKYGYEVDSNQEFVAYGSLNFVMSFFHGFVSASSLACTSLHDSLGGKTQVYGLIASMVTLIGILWVGPVFESAPEAALSAIILANLIGMIMQITNVINLWKINKFDCLIWVVTFSAVVSMKVDLGLLTGLGFSLATVIYRTHAASAQILGRIPGTDIYRNIARNMTAEEIPGIKIFKFEGNLYFGSIENFRCHLFRKTKMNPKKILERMKKEQLKAEARDADLSRSSSIASEMDIETLHTHMQKIRRDDEQIERANTRNLYTVQSNKPTRDVTATDDRMDPELSVSQEIRPSTMLAVGHFDSGGVYHANTKYIILDMSACAFMDSVGVRMLNQIHEDYRKIGITLYMANIVGSVRKILHQSGFYEKNMAGHVFVTVHDAVLAALAEKMGMLMEKAYGTTTETTEDDGITLQVIVTPPGEGEGEELVDENVRERRATLTSQGSRSALAAEVEAMKETMKQLSHHNKLLRRLLDKKELLAADEAAPSVDSDLSDDEDSKAPDLPDFAKRRKFSIKDVFKRRLSAPATRRGIVATKGLDIECQDNAPASAPPPGAVQQNFAYDSFVDTETEQL